MKKLAPLRFSFKELEKELKEFDDLLKSKKELKERKDILPFFKSRLNLSAYIGKFAVYNNNFDRVAHELSLQGDFTCDLVCGDSGTNYYCLVEFEDAIQNSIFKKKSGKQNSEWSSRFDHGYSQLIDWFWKLDSMLPTVDFVNLFGTRDTTFCGLIVIGRDSYLTPAEQNRLKFRENKVIINSFKISCLTYDKLYKYLENSLTTQRQGTIQSSI